MWQYNFDYLCHSSHKYIDKTYKNGRWQYTYPQDLKGHRDTNQTLPLLYVASGGKFTAQNRKDIIRKRNIQNLKDSAYSTRSKLNKNAEKAAKQAEEERKRNSVVNKSKNSSSAAPKQGLSVDKQVQVNKAVAKSIDYLNNKLGTNYGPENSRRADEVAAAKKKEESVNKIQQQVALNKAVAKSIDYLNKTYGLNLGSEAATAAEKERVRRAVEASKDRPAKDQNAREAAIAKSVDATKTATQLANAKKQEAERRRASNTVERSQSARETAISKSAKDTHVNNAANDVYENIKSGYVDFVLPGSYNLDGQNVYFTKEEQKKIALKAYEKLKKDKNITGGQLKRARDFIQERLNINVN